MLGTVYWQDNADSPGAIPESADTSIKVATSAGTVVGQLGFGWLADMVGRKKMYGLELIIIIFATLAQSLTADGPALSIVGALVFWRVLMGIGIGGGKSSLPSQSIGERRSDPPSSHLSSQRPSGVEP
jgi:MFS transporter, PHS family, inorganic phosphate transporter